MTHEWNLCDENENGASVKVMCPSKKNIWLCGQDETQTGFIDLKITNYVGSVQVNPNDSIDLLMTHVNFSSTDKDLLRKIK